MTYYLKQGNTFLVTPKEELDIHDVLPARTFTVKRHPVTGAYFLEIIEDMAVPAVIYGDTPAKAARVLNTFLDREASTGVLLSGEKGSGKTLLAKILSAKAREIGLPTIVINNPWYGEEFNAFISNIDQGAVIIFDEFEKVYTAGGNRASNLFGNNDEGGSAQQGLLTLLDGVYSSKKLFMITTNDKWRIDTHMRNRPGRIFYRMEYTGLTQDFIREYCEANLADTEQTDGVIRMSLLFAEFNFDMLKATVEEMNRYDETAMQVMEVLNAKPEYSERLEYTQEMRLNGTLVKTYEKKLSCNPLTETIGIHASAVPKVKGQRNDWDEAEDEPEDEGWTQYFFEPADLVSVDKDSGAYIFRTGEAELTLTRVKTRVLDYSHLY